MAFVRHLGEVVLNLMCAVPSGVVLANHPWQENHTDIIFPVFKMTFV